jgi:hypothetical protein
MRLRPLALVAACCALLAVAARAQFSSAPIPRPPEPEPRAAEKDRRAPDNTFLTFPEWYLVYSPDEYADLIEDRPPSEFPYLGHIGQMWQGYYSIHQATKDDYPFNADYHVMILIIATSTTVEYGLKWGYETIVGRVSEASRTHGLTPEDRLAAEVARDYVTFLDREPWFNYDFLTPLQRLWNETGWWSSDPLRSWERKYYLTSDFLAKAGYAWLIKRASEGAYGVESQTTAVVLDRLPVQARKALPKVNLVDEAADGSVLAHIPRYQAFTKHALELSRHGVNFQEIAGNRGAILITAVVGDDFTAPDLKMIFVQPILTQPGHKRIAFAVRVSDLATTLRRLDRPGMRVEHVYDF